MILHIVNKSPFSHSALNNCISALKNEDGVVLMEDAVYLLNDEQHPAYKALSQVNCFVIAPHAEARGLQSNLNGANNAIKSIDFDGFVDLVEQHDKTVSWF